VPRLRPVGDLGEEMKTELTIGERWEQGIPHDPRSIRLYQSIAKIDWEQCSDSFGFKSGGDGDNGETLMYLLDVHFAQQADEP
jgi:hypothetical protein